MTTTAEKFEVTGEDCEGYTNPYPWKFDTEQEARDWTNTFGNRLTLKIFTPKGEMIFEKSGDRIILDKKS